MEIEESSPNVDSGISEARHILNTMGVGAIAVDRFQPVNSGNSLVGFATVRVGITEGFALSINDVAYYETKDGNSFVKFKEDLSTRKNSNKYFARGRFSDDLNLAITKAVRLKKADSDKATSELTLTDLKTVSLDKTVTYTGREMSLGLEPEPKHPEDDVSLQDDSYIPF